MILIDSAYVRAVEAATTGLDLASALQSAIELEHSTIPPYLVAAYSLKEGTNTAVRRAIIAIAREEMLHMTIVCNVLNALGGQPHVGGEAFVPQYPTTLPMGIQGSLQVGLVKFSKDAVRDVFMKIEEPETPLRFPGLREAMPPAFSTIGEFYAALIAKIAELGDGAFTGDPARQVAGRDTGFPPDRLFPIVNAQTAASALRWIVEDGEGTTTSPLDTSGQLAHYYRFEEMLRGRALVPDATVPEGYSFTGTLVPFDPGAVFDIPDNPKAADYAPGTFERDSVDEFNQEYSDLLRLLDRVFDGHPALISSANSKMGQLRGMAVSTMRLVDNATGRNVGVSFEYMPPAQ